VGKPGGDTLNIALRRGPFNAQARGRGVADGCARNRLTEVSGRGVGTSRDCGLAKRPHRHPPLPCLQDAEKVHVPPGVVRSRQSAPTNRAWLTGKPRVCSRTPGPARPKSSYALRECLPLAGNEEARRGGCGRGIATSGSPPIRSALTAVRRLNWQVPSLLRGGRLGRGFWESTHTDGETAGPFARAVSAHQLFASTPRCHARLDLLAIPGHDAGGR
jgi:hypothetical protein